MSSTAVTVSDTDAAYSTVAFSGSLVVWDDRRNGNATSTRPVRSRDRAARRRRVRHLHGAGRTEGTPPSTRSVVWQDRRGRLGHLCLRPERTARLRRLHGARRPDPARRVRRDRRLAGQSQWPVGRLRLRPLEHGGDRDLRFPRGAGTPGRVERPHRLAGLPAAVRAGRTTSPPGATTARWCTGTAAPRARLWRGSGPVRGRPPDESGRERQLDGVEQTCRPRCPRAPGASPAEGQRPLGLPDLHIPRHPIRPVAGPDLLLRCARLPEPAGQRSRLLGRGLRTAGSATTRGSRSPLRSPCSCPAATATRTTRSRSRTAPAARRAAAEANSPSIRTGRPAGRRTRSRPTLATPQCSLSR